MVNINDLLSGPVTLEAIKLLFELHSTGLTQEPKLGQLALFENTICSAEECGVESTGLSKMALIGRWDVVSMPGQKILLKCAPNEVDSEDFKKIFGISFGDLAEKIFQSIPPPPTVRVHQGWAHVGNIAADCIGGAMHIAGAQIYDPEKHGQEIVEIDSVN